MPLKLKMAFDGGQEEFTRILNKGAELIKDLSPFFKEVVNYFEGKNNKFKSGISTIYETQGEAISSDWTVTEKYSSWKAQKWGDMRQYTVPITGNSLQVLSGKTLFSLLDSASGDAVRRITPNTLEYGTTVNYAQYNQTNKRILDFFPEMEQNITSLFRLFLHETIPGIDNTGDKN